MISFSPAATFPISIKFIMCHQLPFELIRLIEKEYNNITGMVISKNNHITHQHYFQGYNENDTVHIASVTKSIFSILIGIAIDKGFIKSVNQKILAFFPTYEIKQREKTLQKVTLKHLLSMTAPYKFKSEPYTKVYSSEDWTKSVLDLIGGKNLSENFKYTTIGIQVLSSILSTATGESVVDFAFKNLFKPLGIKKPDSIRLHNKNEHIAFLKDRDVHGWVTDPNGIHTSGWGLTLTTCDLLKIGQLVLNKGNWKNQIIVSQEWLSESTRIQSQWESLAYGYLWWIIDNDNYKEIAAIGDGGNIIYINFKKKIVIAITSSFMPRAKDRIELIHKYILPFLDHTNN